MEWILFFFPVSSVDEVSITSSMGQNEEDSAEESIDGMCSISSHKIFFPVSTGNFLSSVSLTTEKTPLRDNLHTINLFVYVSYF